MRIIATADLHGTLPEIPECDILLIGGDICPVWDHDRKFQARWLRTEFKRWLEGVSANHIVAVGGNHDFVLNDSLKFKKELPWTLLYDESVVVEGIKIWGSPMSPRFGGWAFMRDDRGLAEVWEKIDPDTDILMVHGPIYGYRDEAGYEWIGGEGFRPSHTGSQTLRNRLEYGDFSKLKTFICGHIHEAYGEMKVHGIGSGTVDVLNVSLMDGKYRPINEPKVIEWD